MNKLFYGDNLDVLRGFADESVDLIYLDPPFNSIAQFFHGPKPNLPPLVGPVKKASRVETRASHQKGSRGALL